MVEAVLPEYHQASKWRALEPVVESTPHELTTLNKVARFAVSIGNQHEHFPLFLSDEEGTQTMTSEITSALQRHTDEAPYFLEMFTTAFINFSHYQSERPSEAAANEQLTGDMAKIASLLDSLAPVLQEQIASDTHLKTVLASTYASAFKFLQPETRNWAGRVIATALPEFSLGSIDPNTVLDQENRLIQAFIAGASKENISASLTSLADENGKVSEQGKVLLPILLLKYFQFHGLDETYQEIAGLVFHSVNYGLDMKDKTDIWRAWMSVNHGSKSGSERMKGTIEWQMKNILTIHLLERERPGITQTLYKEFGIRNFARYPRDVLIEQYDRRNDVNADYGVVVRPLEDYNNVFGTDEQTGRNSNLTIYQATKEADDNATVRFIEAGSKEEFTALLERLKERYALHKGARYLILGGHGNPNAIHLGNGSEREGIIKREDIVKRMGQLVGDVLDENKIVILHACSTGKIDRNVHEFTINDKKKRAVTLSNPIARAFTQFGITVYAPAEESTIGNLQFTGDSKPFARPKVDFIAPVKEISAGNDERIRFVDTNIFTPRSFHLKTH